MRKKMQRLILAVIALALSLNLYVNTAEAAQIAGGGVNVTIHVTGEAPEAEEYVVVMKSEDASYPMPEGTVDGEYRLVITGEGTAQLPEIIYTKVGVYTYTIWQEKGTNEECTYDETVYEMVVQVTNAENGEGFEVVSIVRVQGEEEKEQEVEFTNQYPEPTPEPTPTATPEPTTTPTPGEDVKTGDENAVGLYLFLFAVAGACVVVAMKHSRKEEM